MASRRSGHFLIISNGQVIMEHAHFSDAARDADERAQLAPIGNPGSRFWVAEVRASYQPVKRVQRHFISIGTGRDDAGEWLRGLWGEVSDRLRRVRATIMRLRRA